MPEADPRAMMVAKRLRGLQLAKGSPGSREIAALAGVSHTTVVEALNGRRLVRFETLSKIIFVLDGDNREFYELIFHASEERGTQMSDDLTNLGEMIGGRGLTAQHEEYKMPDPIDPVTRLMVVLRFALDPKLSVDNRVATALGFYLKYVDFALRHTFVWSSPQVLDVLGTDGSTVVVGSDDGTVYVRYTFIVRKRDPHPFDNIPTITLSGPYDLTLSGVAESLGVVHGLSCEVNEIVDEVPSDLR
jgi:transcriptional regulator with XRE-family HTH domain